MKPRFILFTAGIGILLLFVFFSFLVDINIFKQFDFDITVRLQDNLSRRFDTIFSWFSVLGMFEVTMCVLVGFLIYGRKILAGILTLLLFVIFHVIEIFGKAVVENTPPPEFLLRTERLVEFPQFHVRSEYSYPSGHSGRTLFLSVILVIFVVNSPKLSKLLKILIICSVLLYDGLMLLSRVYLGEHWLTDVIGGAMLGGALGLLTGTFYVPLINLHPDSGKKTKKSR